MSLRAVLRPFPFLLVAGLASVASPPVVALRNVHANVHGVVTCRGTTQKNDYGCRMEVKEGFQPTSLPKTQQGIVHLSKDNVRESFKIREKK